MSSKRRKEKSYSIHGMRSILSAFISRHQLAIKPYDSYATNRASTGCLFRCLKQFGHVKKKIQFIDIKVHLYFKSRLVTINGVFDYIRYKQFPQYTPYKQFPQCTQYKQYPRKEKRGKKMGMEEKAVDLKKGKKMGVEEKVVDFKKKRGGMETKEKDIMKRRQERGEEEKKMGTEERERRRNR